MARNTIIPEFANFPLGPDWYNFWDDFGDEYSAYSAAQSPWVGTALSSGTAVQTTDEKFGVLVLSGAATTDDSGYQIQRDMEDTSLVAGKQLDFLGRLKLSDGTQDEVFVGIAITDTTILDGGGLLLAADLTASDAIGFYKPDGGTLIYGVVVRDGVLLATGSFSIDLTAYTVLAYRVLMDPTTAGTGVVSFYVNGTWIGNINSTTMPYDSEEILALSAAFVTGNNSGTKTCTIDYLGVRQER